MALQIASVSRGQPPNFPNVSESSISPDGGLRLLNALWRSPDRVHQVGTLNRLTKFFTNTPVKDAVDALTRAQALSAQGVDTYFACAEYLSPGSRKADNVAGAYVFWGDIDVAPGKGADGKGYETLDEAKAALKKFRIEAGLPKPTHVVESGGGLHAYWVLDAFVDRATWQAYATKLKAIAKHLGFLADPTRTADIASVLRIPGTLNHKYDPPLPVTLVHEAPQFIAHAAMIQAIDAAFDKLTVVHPVTPTAVVVTNATYPAPVATVDQSSYGPPDLISLASALKVLPPDCDEYTWKFHRMAPLARVARENPELAQNAYALAKSWSSGQLRGIPSEAWVTPSRSTGRTGEQEFEAQWKRFLQPNPSGKQSSVGSIFFHAKELGWTPSAHSTPPVPPATVPAMLVASPVNSGLAARVKLPASLQVATASPKPTALVSNVGIDQQITALPVALPPTLPPEAEAQTVARLAALKPMDYDRARKQEAKALGIQVKTLDQMVKDQRANIAPGELLPFPEVVPWPEPIDPASLFDEIHDTILRYVVMEPEQAVTVTLWIVLTWFVDEVEVLPLLIFNAPEKACGKSQGLTLVGKMAARPIFVANSTASFLFRAIAQWKPALLIDEADTFVNNNDDLKGLINAGHTRANAYVGRTVANGDGLDPVMFSVWGPKCFAGIKMQNHFTAANGSRGHWINMRRKLPHESVERLRNAPAELFQVLSAKLARFAEDYADQVRNARPALPDALSDRQQDNWEPLLAIAQCAGSDWLERGSQAALVMSKSDERTEGRGNELLADIEEVFQQKNTFKITTVELIDALVADEEKGWATYNRGRPLTPRQLAKQLAAYGIQPKTVRMAHGTPKGYDVDQFADAFARYLATPETLPQRPDAALPAAPTVLPIRGAAAVTHVAATHHSDPMDDLDREIARLDACGGVADTSQDTGDQSASEEDDDIY